MIKDKHDLNYRIKKLGIMGLFDDIVTLSYKNRNFIFKNGLSNKEKIKETLDQMRANIEFLYIQLELRDDSNGKI